jgi:nucleoside-diphosphate-sugar epimerase
VKVLITGHRGFVGRWFWRTLAAQGHDLTGVDLAGCDARDFFRTNDDRFDLVVHLAAVVGGRATIEGDPIGVAVDLSIDAEMFGWAVRTGQRRVIYYSSSAAYPVDLQEDYAAARALRETDIRWGAHNIGRPDLTYGWAKLTGEMLAGHAQEQGLRVHVFRPFSGYGEDQDQEYPFPAFIARAAARADPFLVWGDGHQVRDFIHISDVVAGTLAAVEQDYPGPLNLCTGRATSFRDLAELVTAAAGYRPRLEFKIDAPRGVAFRVGDPAEFLRVYRPRVSLEEGIGRALAHGGYRISG